MELKPHKLNSLFIVSNFPILHEGGRSYFIIHCKTNSAYKHKRSNILEVHGEHNLGSSQDVLVYKLVDLPSRLSAKP